MKSRIYYGSNCATLISIHIPCVSWISNRKKWNPLQHMSTGSKPKQRDATSQMMPPLLGIWLKHWKMPIVWQCTSMTRDLKHSQMPSQKWRSWMPNSSSQQWSFHPPQLMWCSMKKTAVSSVKNQDILHKIALTSGAMSVMNMVMLSWTVHTEYLLQKLQQHITNHTRVTRSTSRHHCEERDRRSLSTSQSHFQRHHSWSHCNSNTGHSRSQHRDRCSHHRCSSQWSHSAHRGQSHIPCHDTPHWSHHRSSQHQSSSRYRSKDPSSSHSQPSYRSSKHEFCQLDSYSSRTRRTPHPKKNMQVKTEDPHTDYNSSDDHSSGSGEDSYHLN